MSRVWVTNGSPALYAMVNTVNMACDEGFIPSRVHMLQNPAIVAQVDDALSYITRTVEAYRGEPPEIRRTTLETELDFDGMRVHHQHAIESAKECGEDVAVDITPGRKFMSAIAFAAGMRYGADHVYYFHLSATSGDRQLYPEFPRTATTLYDFTEVV